MTIIAKILWILIWGLVMFFTVKIMNIGVEIRQMERNMTFRFEHLKTLEKKANGFNVHK